MANRVTDFDWKILDALLQRGTFKKDAAAIMDCSEDTVERRIKEAHGITFTEYREKKLANTKMKLVEKAISMALSGNVTMLIFSLKNMCGWKDKFEHTGEESSPIKLSYNLDAPNKK